MVFNKPVDLAWFQAFKKKKKKVKVKLSQPGCPLPPLHPHSLLSSHLFPSLRTKPTVADGPRDVLPERVSFTLKSFFREQDMKSLIGIDYLYSLRK